MTRQTVTPQAFFTAYDALLARWGPDVEHLDVPTPYGTTRVNAIGPPDAPPLLLLPGGGDTSASWFVNAPEWARARRVLAADLIGDAGRSVPAEGRRIAAVDDLNRWLDALLDGLDIERTALVGHSYGAWIALSYALTSTRVERLALLDPTNCFAGFRPGYLLRALPMLLRPSPGRVRSFLRWETRGARLDPDWLRQQEAAAGFRTARPVTGPRPDAAGLRAPALILFTERGRAQDATAVARTAATRLPHAEIALLPTSHHGLQHQAPDELTAVVGKFLARDGARSG